MATRTLRDDVSSDVAYIDRQSVNCERCEPHRVCIYPPYPPYTQRNRWRFDQVPMWPKSRPPRNLPSRADHRLQLWRSKTYSYGKRRYLAWSVDEATRDATVDRMQTLKEARGEKTWTRRVSTRRWRSLDSPCQHSMHLKVVAAVVDRHPHPTARYISLRHTIPTDKQAQ